MRRMTTSSRSEGEIFALLQTSYIAYVMRNKSSAQLRLHHSERRVWSTPRSLSSFVDPPRPDPLPLQNRTSAPNLKAGSMCERGTCCRGGCGGGRIGDADRCRITAPRRGWGRRSGAARGATRRAVAAPDALRAGAHRPRASAARTANGCWRSCWRPGCRGPASPPRSPCRTGHGSTPWSGSASGRWRSTPSFRSRR